MGCFNKKRQTLPAKQGLIKEAFIRPSILFEQKEAGPLTKKEVMQNTLGNQQGTGQRPNHRVNSTSFFVQSGFVGGAFDRFSKSREIALQSTLKSLVV